MPKISSEWPHSACIKDNMSIAVYGTVKKKVIADSGM